MRLSILQEGGESHFSMLTNTHNKCRAQCFSSACEAGPLTCVAGRQVSSGLGRSLFEL